MVERNDGKGRIATKLLVVLTGTRRKDGQATHLLTAPDVSGAEPDAKSYRLADGGGPYLWVPPSGVKAWQFRYRHGGKPQSFTFGKVSKTQGLAWARAKADEARSRVEDGDP